MVKAKRLITLTSHVPGIPFCPGCPFSPCDPLSPGDPFFKRLTSQQAKAR